MSKNLQSPTKLTEFAPIKSEEKPQSVGKLITKFFKLNKALTPNEEISNIPSSNSDNISQESLPAWAIDAASESTSVYHVDVNEGRSLPNVLKRISNLLALKSNNLLDYGDTELKQYWMPDSVSKECYECCDKFTTFRRRHHCRVCGQIFCSQCCNQQIPGKIFGCTGDLRVCTYCCKVVLSYLQSSDFGAELTADLKNLQESLQSKFGDVSASPSNSMQDSGGKNFNKDSLDVENISRRKISVGYQEEKFASGHSGIYLTAEEKCKVLQKSSSLRALYEEICSFTNGITLGTHRYRLRTYVDCFLGSELVDWLICQQKASNRTQAVAICQALLEGGYIECVSDPCSFVDGYALYKPGLVTSSETLVAYNFPDLGHNEDPTWVQQIQQESGTTDSDSDVLPTSQAESCRKQLTSSSSYVLDLNVEASAAYLSKPASSDLLPQQNSPSEGLDAVPSYKYQEMTTVRTSEQREFVPESGWHNASNLRNENGEKLAYHLLVKAFEQHEQSLLKQLLLKNNLPLIWMEKIIPLCHEIIEIIRPDKNHDADDLDIRHYVKFKKLPGGSINDTKLINGVVCSKNVAHKGMVTEIDNPKILLLLCSIVYQRTEGRLMSLEPVLMQEHEYLRHVAARIVALQPDIVLVHRNVSRLAQDFLRQQGITLVYNVKQSVLEQLSRCTQADLVTALDAHIGKPKLGSCKKFYIKTYGIKNGDSKTLMFFEGLELPHLGGTILLRGAPINELIRLESVASFFLFANYSWRLEKSFLMDEFAQPPNSSFEFLDGSKENSPTLQKDEELLTSKRICYNSILREIEDESEIFASDSGLLKIEPISNTCVETSETLQTGDDVNITEHFTDPLQNYSDDFNRNIGDCEELKVTEIPLTNSFKKCLDDSVLCISPYLKFPIPYLETEMGKKCKLRNFFPSEIYFSKQFNSNMEIKSIKHLQENGKETVNEKTQPLHEFLTTRITSIDCNRTQALLSHFRATGGRFEKKNTVVKTLLPQCSAAPTPSSNNNDSYLSKIDVLEINNHQRLAVLFCSFSHESHNAPAFCVNPWIVNMNFYGSNDIPLGCFLERYCFRSSYNCPSKSCVTPMTQHIRRFVHNAGCISITLNSFDNEYIDEKIVMWTWCTKCQSVSPVVPMSNDTWSFSFGKYLELKFYGGIYNRRGNNPCRHSLHQDHYQYFRFKNLVASFKYSTIQMWEISLPPSVINIRYNLEKNQSEMIDEIRTLAQKGHEIYCLILEKLVYVPQELEGIGNLKQLLLKEQSQFKQRVEEVQLKLTSPSIEKCEFLETPNLHIPFWKIADSITRIKRAIVDTVDNWNLRLSSVCESARKKDDKRKDRTSYSDLESPTTSENRIFDSNSDSSSSTNANITDALSSNENSRQLELIESEDNGNLHQKYQFDGTTMSQSDEQYEGTRKDSEKKSVKNILSQLLPSSAALSLIPYPFNPQEHYTLPTGVYVPLVVYENEPSSIIAYAVNSFDYKKSFEDLKKKQMNSEQAMGPAVHVKGLSEKEKSDENDEKASSFLSFLRKDLNVATGTNLDISHNHIIENQVGDKIEDGKKFKNLHIEVQFQDVNCNFFCRIYFAEKFSVFRDCVLPIGEEAFIRSLARSIQWNARGGKSGSTFSKTLDDRFILKEMTKSEIQLFLDSAPNYFNYMQKCYSTGQPTLLGKIVGVYQIIFKNSSNITLRRNLLVMENLFYNRTVSQKFDLKGSVRNRLVIPDNQDGEIVLLDENLLKMTCDAPLYILPHSKAVLTAAIQNDTEFLSAHSVMDYSLLVGLDSENKELVLGIIDYIRTFTWDKKLETMVKKTGILGGQGKLPTIVSPEEYQKRFIEAMHRYFLEVPDHWTGLGKGLEF